jgi:Cu2+-exporting ATPase
MLSGDDQHLVQSTARDLGIAEAHGEQNPQSKLQFLKQLQASGASVAVVGDGINDAAMLSAADESFAMGGGTALAQVNADAVILSDNLADLLLSMGCAAATMRIVKQNLAWAAFYNLAAVPLAAFGWLTPGWAGLGMAASSLFVVVNALRLQGMRQYPIQKSKTRQENPACSPSTLQQAA